MKVIRKKTAYFQRKDFIFILTSGKNNLPPDSIIRKALGKTGRINEKNEDEFIKVKKPHEIEYVKGLDCVLDFDYIISMSTENFRELMQSINNEAEETYEVLNQEISPENVDTIQDSIFRLAYLKYRKKELLDYLDYISGDKKISLPREIKKEIKKKNKKLLLEYKQKENK